MRAGARPRIRGIPDARTDFSGRPAARRRPRRAGPGDRLAPQEGSRADLAAGNPYQYRGIPGCPPSRGAPLSEPRRPSEETMADETERRLFLVEHDLRGLSAGQLAIVHRAL